MSCNIDMPALSAADLIQDLLVANGEQLAVQSLCRAGVLVGIQEATIRVALNRLVCQGKVTHCARGYYAMSRPGPALSRAVDEWQHRDALTIQWSGAWVGVQDAGVQRSDKITWRHHLLALNLLGFRLLLPGLHIRPDNLKGGSEAVRKRLQDLGLSPKAAVFRVTELDSECRSRALALWDTGERMKQCRSLRQALKDSACKFKTAGLEENVRESLHLGRTVMVWLLRDPLLPSEMSDSKGRIALTQEMFAYQEAALVLWRRWLAGG